MEIESLSIGQRVEVSLGWGVVRTGEVVKIDKKNNLVYARVGMSDSGGYKSDVLQFSPSELKKIR